MMMEPLDANPELGQKTKVDMGIDNDYFVSVPRDPSDDEAKPLIVELRHLTPDGRPLS